MKKSVGTLIHIGFWFCYIFMILIILGAVWRGDEKIFETRSPTVFKGIFLFALLPSAIAFYSFYLILFPKYLQQKKIFLSVILGILISILSAVIGYVLLSLMDSEKCMKGGENDPVGMLIFMSILALVNGIIALVIKGFITWFAEIKLKEALKEKNHEMEMALIKSQLDPHFLFNTINNIDVLILKDATVASEYLNKLSDIMRFMLYETKSDKILLSREIEYIEKYVELQKIRTSNQSFVNFLVTGNPGNKTIAPMVFIPFIENAFKHSTNKKLENAITINILIIKDSIQFTCENRFNPNAKKEDQSNGLGNNLIQKRLNLIYPEKHILEVVKHDELYKVSLTINNG